MSRIILALTLLTAIAIATPARATSIVTLDTTPLQAIGGTWYLDFQLADGDGSANNSVTLANLTLGGGAQQPPDALAGGGSGAFPSYSLTDSDFFNQVLIAFTAGTHVQFELSYTNNFAGGFSADTFTWAVLDANFSPIVTDPNSLGAGLVILLDGTTNITLVPADADLYASITPEIRALQEPNAAVPEPMTGLLVLTGLAGVFRRRFRT